jgi:hypothetical protein
MGRRTKKNYIQDGTFAELMEAAEQALAYERGARDDYRVTQMKSTKSPQKAPASEAVSPESNPSSRRKHKNAADR